jgi:very-short-patch-repair endonuclease
MSPRARPPSVIRHAAIDSNKLKLARRFRRTPTTAEAVAWEILRNGALFGLRFRRQQILAGFIVDFYCASQRLVLELDDGVHEDPTQRDHDRTRSQSLQRLAIRVLRIPNHSVHEQALREVLAPYAPPPRSRNPALPSPLSLARHPRLPARGSPRAGPGRGGPGG